MLSYDSLRKYNINIKFVFITIDPERGTLSIHFQAFSTYENVSNELHKKYFFFQSKLSFSDGILGASLSVVTCILNAVLM